MIWINANKLVESRMNSEGTEPIELIHHGILSHHESSHIETNVCSGDEDGNSSENQNRSPPIYESNTSGEPKAKKRRKQSNPVRYQTTPVVPLLDGEEGEELLGDQVLDLQHKPEPKISDSQESTFRCHHCNSLFDKEDLLRIHVEEEHVQKLLEKQLQQQQQSCNKSTSGNIREGSIFESSKENSILKTSDVSSQPSSSDMPGSSSLEILQHENKDFKNPHFPFPGMPPPFIPFSRSEDCKSGNLSVPLSMFPNPMAPFLFPVIPQGQTPPVSNGNSHSSPGVRIFNLEAYCELCNKEFCNKYFLKTHKANKHGIYSMDSIIGSPYPGSFMSPGLSNPLPLPPLLPSSSSESLSTRQGILNVESFCELCQKEFCNKYFLKKHRQKIHGIIEVGQNISPIGTPLSLEAKDTSPISTTNSVITSICNMLSTEKNSAAFQEESHEISKPEFSNLFNFQNHKITNSLSVITTTPTSVCNTPTTCPTASFNTSLSDVPIPLLSNSSEKLPHSMVSSTPDKLPHSLVSTTTDKLPHSLVSTVSDKLSHSLVSTATDKLSHPLISTTADKLSHSLISTAADKMSHSLISTAADKLSHSLISTTADKLPLSLVCSTPDKLPLSLVCSTPDKLPLSLVCSTPDKLPLSLVCSTPDKLTHSMISNTPDKLPLSLVSTSSEKMPTVLSSPSEKVSTSLLPNTSEKLTSLLTSTSEKLASTLLSSSPNDNSGHVFTPEKLREIGVINADAFCEICCKEFCNKYFLRTHRLNKHGISTADTPSSTCTSSCSKPTQPQQQQQPQQQILQQPPTQSQQNNVIPLDKNELNNMAVARIEENHSESHFNQEILHGSEQFGDLSCEFCNRPFSSLYLLKMHKFYTHNIPYIKEESKSKPSSPTNERGSQDSKESIEIPRMPNPHDNIFPTLQEDAASQDLQKLQSMIRELNASAGVESNKIVCNLCQLDFDNKYFLRAHMMNEHGVLPNEDGHVGYNSDFSIFSKASDLSSSFQKSIFSGSSFLDSEAFCEICQKEFCSKYFLKTHRQNIHGIPVDVPLPPKKIAPLQEEPSQQKPVSIPSSTTITTSITPTPLTDSKPKTPVTGRNYCNICNKELCNKYFMKTHMLKMHGINLDNQPNEAARSSIIGGVTCDICQKELCSKYFLKVHKQNTHGIFEEPTQIKDSFSQISLIEKDLSNQCLDLSDPHGRYFNHYPEVCPICNCHFKSIKWLKAHMANDHGSILKENIPSQSENILSTENNCLCVICGQGFADKVALHVHLIKDHHSATEELGVGSNSGMNTISDSSAVMLPDQPRLNGSSSPGSASHQSNQPRPQLKQPGVVNSNSSSSSTNVGGGSGNNGSGNGNSGNGGIVTSGSGNNSSNIGGGGGSNGSSGGSRIYHCSFCVYSTRWLSNLYAHEKRHTGVNTEGEKKFVCRICQRAYRYNHSLQRHFLSHRAAGLSLRDMAQPLLLTSHSHRSHSSTPSLDEPWNLQSVRCSNIQEKPLGLQQPLKIKRYRCSKCNKKFRSREMCLAHIHAIHSGRKGGIILQKSIKPFRCRFCGFATRAWNVLKIHINKQHSNDADSPKVTQQENETTLNSVTSITAPLESPKLSASTAGSFHSKMPPPPNSPHLPMTFAMPQNPPTAGSFFMQPFLLTQPECDEISQNGTFVPSLVYLPVYQKVLQSMTVTLTLTPA